MAEINNAKGELISHKNVRIRTANETDRNDAKFSFGRIGQEKNSGHYRGWTLSKRTLSRVDCTCNLSGYNLKIHPKGEVNIALVYTPSAEATRALSKIAYVRQKIRALPCSDCS